MPHKNKLFTKQSFFSVSRRDSDIYKYLYRSKRLLMKIDQIVEGYIIYLRNIRRYSPNTIKAYKSDLTDFIKYCNDNNKIDIASINERFIKSYLMNLSEKELEKISIVRKLSSLRGLFRFAFKEDLIKQNPTSQVRESQDIKETYLKLLQQKIF